MQRRHTTLVVFGMSLGAAGVILAIIAMIKRK